MKKVVILILSLVILAIATGCASAQYDGTVSGGSSQKHQGDDPGPQRAGDGYTIPERHQYRVTPVTPRKPQVVNNNTINNYYPVRTSSGHSHPAYRPKTKYIKVAVPGPTHTVVKYVPVPAPVAKPQIILVTTPPAKGEAERKIPMNMEMFGIIAIVAIVAIVALRALPGNGQASASVPTIVVTPQTPSVDPLPPVVQPIPPVDPPFVVMSLAQFQQMPAGGHTQPPTVDNDGGATFNPTKVVI